VANGVGKNARRRSPALELACSKRQNEYGISDPICYAGVLGTEKVRFGKAEENQFQKSSQLQT
jgi:hypothetical protein